MILNLEGLDVDRLTKIQRSYLMSCIRGKDTRPEMLVRRLVHGLGYRYRIHCHELPGRPDLVFPGRRKIIFVNGCFWHYHKDCVAGSLPATNSDYWEAKLNATRTRDRSNRAKLQRRGWKTETIWECQLGDIQLLESRVRKFLKE